MINGAFSVPTTPGAAAQVLETASGIGVVVLLATVIASIISLILRFVGAKGEERQQLKWFAYTAGLSVVSFLLAGAFGAARWDLLNTVAWTLGVAALFSLPVAVGIAILKYHLYDIDIFIHRTLVYGALTGVLALVYVAGVVGVGGLVRGLTGQERNNIVVAASTLAVAALFRSARSHIQAFIDRSFYRRKYDAVRTLEHFSTRLREEIDLESISTELLGVVQDTMQPAQVSLWLREREGRTRQPA